MADEVSPGSQLAVCEGQDTTEGDSFNPDSGIVSVLGDSGVPTEMLAQFMDPADLQALSLQPESSIMEVTTGRDGRQTVECRMQQITVQVHNQKMSLEAEGQGRPANRGYNSLQAAILYSDDPKIAQDLIDAGYDVNATSTISGETPLHVALKAERKHQETYVKMLLKAGCKLGAKDANGDTVLHLCKQPEILILLISVCDYSIFEARNMNGYTPLQCAIDAGFNEAVEKMLDGNVDPNVQDFEGNNALHLASRDELTGSTGREANEWIHVDIGVNWQSLFFKTATGAGLSVTTYKRLISRMEDVDAQNNTFRTALHLAVEHNCIKVVKLLLESGANAFEIPDSKGLTAYDVACSKNDIAPEILGLLGERMPNKRVLFTEVRNMLQKLELTFTASCVIPDEDKNEFMKASTTLAKALTKHQRKDAPMSKEHRSILMRSFDSLLEEIAPGSVLEILDAEGIFSSGLVSEIFEIQGRRAQCRKMLEMLMKADRRAFPIFCKALTLTDQSHVLEIMKERLAVNTSDEQSAQSIPNQGRPMPEEHKVFIRENRDTLLNKMLQISKKKFLRSLLSNGILTKAMVIDLGTGQGEEALQRVLDILPYRGRNALPVFCRSLALLDGEYDSSSEGMSGGELYSSGGEC